VRKQKRALERTRIQGQRGENVRGAVLGKVTMYSDTIFEIAPHQSEVFGTRRKGETGHVALWFWHHQPSSHKTGDSLIRSVAIQ